MLAVADREHVVAGDAGAVGGLLHITRAILVAIDAVHQSTWVVFVPECAEFGPALVNRDLVGHERDEGAGPAVVVRSSRDQHHLSSESIEARDLSSFSRLPKTNIAKFAFESNRLALRTGHCCDLFLCLGFVWSSAFL